MNRIYRSIWNQATGAYAAVSENVKSAGKRSMPGCSGGGAHFALTSMAAALMLGYGSLALAGPAGGTVVAGQASITGAPGSTVIKQGSQNAVINWANFNINKGESVQFVQPNSNAVALNRVLGGDGTTILGNLSANGKVFIVNPNGVLFGQGASVNTAGLVASTLDINNADFMSGKYQFSGNGTGKVLNQGSISAPGGYVALLGANVSNEGTIQARLGSVALAAGRAITLDVAGDGLLNVAVNAGAVGALVSNGGMIKADGGSVVLTAQAAGDLLKTVVNNTGVIEAHTIDTRSGTIKLLGDMQTGTVNAAGTLDASAPAGGKGGFIDTSAAHVKLDDALKVTTASSKGLTGTWLIDPSDYTIAATGGDQTGAFYTNALKSTSVQIQSISGGTGTLGNINVNDTISWSANQLKMTAQNNININQPLRGSGTASLALEYGQANVASGNTSKYNVKAEIDLPSGLNFSTKLGSDGTATAYTVINSLGADTSVSGTDLQGLKNALSGKFVLGANIDATVTSTWNGGLGFTSIGTTSVPFTGQFDGLGHVITGLNSSTTSAAGVAGLFGSNLGSLRNIGLVAPVIAANIASTQGNAAALVAINSGTISNAYVSGGSVTVTTGAIGAGLVGLNSGTISDSYNSSKVSVVGNYDFWMGGLVGNTTKTSTIINSYNAGEVVGAYTAGGLVGNNLGAITNSFNSGNVSGTINTGGLTSHNRGTGVITNSFNTGAVTSNSLTGGLVGSNVASGQILNSYSTGAVTSRSLTATGIGGLVGGNSGIIRNSYATGAVTGVTAVGGLIGANTSAGLTENAYSSGAVSLLSGGTGTLGGLIGSIAAGTNPSITGGYYNNTVNSGMPGVGTNGGGTTPAITGLTASQMQVAANFSAFAFTTTTGATGNNWVMVNTDGTLNGAGNATGATGPMLAAEYSSNIYSSHQLQLMAMNLAGNYTLKQDINAAGTGTGSDVWNGGTFVPVGTSSGARFTGTFDGAGHVISGLVVNRPGADYAGLFGATSGTAIVRNVGLEGGSITGKDATGALVGNNAGIVSGNYSTASVTGSTDVGGLVGNNSGAVSNSYASGTVSGVTDVGGLVGLNSGTLTNNYATGAVSGTASVGGLVGANSGGTATGNFWDTTTTGQFTSATGTGLTTAQMKLLSTYSGASWDLASTWIVYDTNTYPLLRAFMTPLQVTFASNASKTYDGTSNWTAPGATFSNPNAVLSGTLNYGAAGNAVNAGTYAITAGGLYSGQRGYAITSNTATLTIDRKAATLSGATVNARDYDGTTAATLSGGALSGVLSQDIFNINVNTGTFDTKDAGTGKAVTALTTGSAGGNYIVTANGLTGTINQKAVTVTGLAATTKQYDKLASATVTGGTLNGLVTGETLSLGASSGTYQNANAGTDKTLTVTLGTLSDGTGLASNYTLDAPTSVTGTITPKALSWTNLAVDNKEYDGDATAAINKGSITGYVSGEGLISGSTAAFADQNAGNNKVVTVRTTLGNGSGGGLASNYTLADTTVLASITPKTLTLTGVAAGNKTYDGTKAAAIMGGTLGGMINGETVGLGTLSGSFADQNAGNGIAVTVTGGSLSDGSNGGLASNYTLASVTGLKADIAQQGLTVSGVTVTSKDYDGTKAATVTGGTLNGLVNGETLTLSGQSGEFNDQNAGNGKAVTVTGATLGNGSGLASNYTVTNATDATGNITPKALTVTGASAVTRVYDGTNAATLAGGVLDGLVSGETLTLSGLSGAYATKNAGSGKAVTVTGATLADNTGGLASNYTVSNPTSVTGNVTKASISSVSGLSASDKTYDGSTAAVIGGKAVITGIVVGDDLAFSSASGAFSDQNAGTGKTVNISDITLTGNDLANYNFTNTSATATASIARKALTVIGAAAANRGYDGSTAATISGGSLDGLVGKETLTLTSMTGLFADKNVGTAKAVTVSGAVLTGGANGGLASNYTVTDSTGLTANITKATISTVSNIVADSKVYDANTKATVSATGATFNGMVGGDSLSISATSATFADKNAGNGKTVAVSGIALGGLDAGNYNLTSTIGSGTGAITPKALTITGMSAVSKAYDGNTKASVTGGSISGLVGSETLGVTGLTVTFDDKNAGTGKAVTATGTTLVNGGNGGLASNYTMVNPTGFTANITPKALTVSGMTAGTRVYDGTTSATLAGGSLSGVISGETLVLSGGTGVFGDKNAGNGKVVTVSGISLLDGTGRASNYTVSNPSNVTGSITQKVLSVTGALAADKTYDGALDATITGGTLSGLVGSETVGMAAMVGAFADKNVGSGKAVSVTGGALSNGSNGGLASNYTVSNPTGLTASITAKALTVAGQLAGNKVYDGNTAAQLSGGVLAGLVAGETLGLAGQTATFADKNAANGKAVTVTGTSLVDTITGLASNYTVSDPTGLTASITAKALTVAGQLAVNKVYDGNAQASLSGGALSGLVAGESLGIGGQTATFADKNAANGKAVTVSGTTLVDTASGLASNYTVSNPTGLTASITAKALTVAGQVAGNKVYDGNTAAQLSGGVLAGLVAGEALDIAGQTAVFSDKNAANGKAVTVTGTTLVDTASGLASNYTVSNPTGLTASVTAKALTVAGQVAGNKVYDGNAEASLSGGVLNGLVSGETLVIGGQSAAFTDKNAGTAKTVTVTGTTLLDTASGLASNYTVSNPTGLTASITPKALTVAGQLAGNKVYDGNTAAQLSGGVLAGLVAGEALDIAGQTAVFRDKNAANGKAVTVTGTSLVDTITGQASNYTVSNPTGLTASITAKALTVSGQLAGNKVYDGNAEASLSGGALSGLVAGESLGIAGQTAVFSDKNAANGKAVTVTGTTLVDTASGLASNYTVSNPSGLTASITPKALTVAGQLAGNKVYDGNVEASLSGGALSGLVAGESLGLAGQTASFADKNAATAKAVTVTGTTLVDTVTGLASNYMVSNPTGLTASITPASLLVRATGAAPRVYDTTTNASVTLADNRIAGDVLSISNSGASFADKNAGANKTVTVNGIALGGTDAGNYTVNATATTTASITQAELGVKVGNAEKDQGNVNPAFTASYTGLLGNDTLANEVSGNLAFSTPATIATPSGSYLVSAAGQTSTNYALTYTPGVLTVKPTEALQSAVASVIAAVNVAPSQGNMVQADVVAKGETVTSKEDVVQVVAERGQPQQGGTPVVLTTASVNSNVLPGLRLSVVDTGLRLPSAAGNTSIESQ